MPRRDALIARLAALTALAMLALALGSVPSSAGDWRRLGLGVVAAAIAAWAFRRIERAQRWHEIELRELARDEDARREAQRQLVRQAEAIAAVADATRELSRADATTARPAICHATLNVTDAMVAVLYEADTDGRGLVSTASVGAKLPGTPIPFVGPPSVAIETFTTGRPFFVPDFDQQPQLSPTLVEATGARAALGQPVIRDSVTVGVLVVVWDHPLMKLDEQLASIMRLLAAEAAVAIERADLFSRLESVARTDDLTGLANRRALYQELPRELARAKREETPLCVAMLDLDHFKAYNDEHGHQAGDRLLKQAAAAWRQELRATDVLARYGGEEFAVVLPGCTHDEAVRMVERLRLTTPAGETASGGVAAWDGEEAPEGLLGRADAALYEAKATGRDRVVSAT